MWSMWNIAEIILNIGHMITAYNINIRIHYISLRYNGIYSFVVFTNSHDKDDLLATIFNFKL